MRKIVSVVHPVPLLCRHRTPGQARVDFDQATTPVRLREAGEDEFDHVADLVGDMVRDVGKTRMPILAHEGSLWRRAAYRADALIEVIESGEPHHIGESGWRIARSLRRSPLGAIWLDGPSRGQPADTRRVRRVLADGTERARADLVRFLDGNVRIVGDAVMLRCRGPQAVHAGTQMTPSFRVHLTGFRFEGVSNMLASEHVVAPRADRVDEFWRFESAFHLRQADGRPSRRNLDKPPTVDLCGLDDVDPALFDDEDLLGFACEAPLVVLRGLDPAAMAVEAVRAAAERLHPWVATGLLGATRAEEFETVASLVCGLVEAVEAGLGPAHAPRQVRKLGAYGREIALPRIRAVEPDMPPEDVESLASLSAPGP